MKFFLVIGFVLWTTTAALAQQPDALTAQRQRNEFMAAFAQCDTTSLALRDQIKALSAQVEELKKKLPPDEEKK